MLDIALPRRRDQWERLASKILDRRVQIFLSSELGIIDDQLQAFTSPGIAAMAQRRRPDLSRGLTPAIVVCDGQLSKKSPFLATVDFDAAVVHELGHIAELDVTTELCSQWGSVELERTLATPWRTWPAHAGPRWAGHDFRFIRGLLHVIYRIESRGLKILPGLAFDPRCYGLLSTIEELEQSLGDEPSRNSWRPIADVLAEPAPVEFLELWGRNVADSNKPSLI
ncbi:MAG: hypothetical protein U0929_15335 [Planctomycetaceae bacterium]